MESLLEDFYINLEETRNKLLSYQQIQQSPSQHLQAEHAIDCHISLDRIYRIIQSLHDAIPLPTGGGDGDVSSNHDEQHVYVAMAESCAQKSSDLSSDVMTLVTNTEKIDGKGSSVIDDGIDCQHAISQIMEISIRLHLECQSQINSSDTRVANHRNMHENGVGKQHSGNTNVKKDKFAEQYAEYQRTLLRNRSKQSIAALANIRKISMAQSIPITEYIESTIAHENELDDNANGHSPGHAEGCNEVEKRPHANAITVILGECSSLIHPLLMWRDGISSALNHLQQQDAFHSHDTISRVNSLETDVQSTLLQMCNETISILHKEAQNLAKTVGEWFLEDTDPAKIDVPLDSCLDEMAFICQVLHRYESFTNPFIHTLVAQMLGPDGDVDVHNGNNASIIISQHIAEQVLQYTTSETKLLSTNIDRAISLAQPVQIIMGTDRYVPSVVEDAYYISQRSLERASTTMSSKTISILANWVVEVWSVGGGVWNALMEQKGCYVAGDSGNDGNDGNRDFGSASDDDRGKKEAPSSFNIFLSALDKDLSNGDNINGKGKTLKKGPRSGPPSGSIDIHKVQMDTQFCLLNGIHAASSACTSLSSLFDSLLPEEEENSDEMASPSSSSDALQVASLINCAKEQLQSHCNSYNLLICDQIKQFLQEWIGTVKSTENPPPLIASLPHAPSMHRFFYHISKQEYNLDAATLREAESNLKGILRPFQESRLMRELQNGKCDDGVTLHLMQIMSHQVVDMFLSTLLNQKQNRFSEWGSLLLSGQMRALEEFFCSGVLIDQNGVDGEGEESKGGNTSLILREFQKMAQAVQLLQCGKPMDWAAFESDVGDTEFDLSKDEIRRVMGLRIDWSVEAIDAVCKK